MKGETMKRFYVLKIKFGAKEVIYKIKDNETLNHVGRPETVAEALTRKSADEICKKLNNEKGNK